MSDQTYMCVLSCRYDETVLPTDYKSAGQMVDDELNAMLVRPLQPGVVLHALIDACHSGTAMDLPYRAKADGGRFNWKVRCEAVCGSLNSRPVQHDTFGRHGNNLHKIVICYGQYIMASMLAVW